jgi:hypothetical protein
MIRSPGTRAPAAGIQNIVSPAPLMGRDSTPAGRAAFAREVLAE